MKEISYEEICKNGINIDDLSDDTEITIKDKERRIILEPFHYVFEGDPEYEDALTFNEALKSLNK